MHADKRVALPACVSSLENARIDGGEGPSENLDPYLINKCGNHKDKPGQ